MQHPVLCALVSCDWWSIVHSLACSVAEHRLARELPLTAGPTPLASPTNEARQEGKRSGQHERRTGDFFWAGGGRSRGSRRLGWGG